jgi:uncharacterized cupredoxin-like copper-binding protein|tara:strand:+ start:667 stop:1200 length:534 start_codon:yes stop_codon:yes gene_type:complete
MYSPTKVLTLLIVLCLSTVGAQASTGIGEEPHAQAYDHPGHVPIGKPGLDAEITRTIEVNIKETESGYMLFDPDAIHIEEGAVVRFVVNNFGDLDHEFFLGSFDEIAKHQQWMRNHPDMKHEDANSIAISSGSTATLDWKFSSKTNLEFVCLIPGHREAGMFGVIMIHDHLAPKPKN